MNERGHGRPDYKFAGQGNSQSKEHGNASGFPNSQLEQKAHSGGIKSPERERKQGVWDILERRTRIWEERFSNRMTSQEYERERSNLIGLEDELDEKGTDRDRLILELHMAITMEPSGTLPIPVKTNELSLQEFQQFRSKVEPLSEEEIREEVRKAEEVFERKSKEKPGPPFPTGGAVTV